VDSQESEPRTTRTTAHQETETRWAHKNLGGLWWAALAAIPFLLAALATVVGADGIESDLRTDSLAALESNELSDVDVAFDGRDATVAIADGGSASSADLDRARDIVAGVQGVRVADIDTAAAEAIDEETQPDPAEPTSDEASAEPTSEAPDPCTPEQLNSDIATVLGEDKIQFVNGSTEFVGDGAAEIQEVAMLLAGCGDVTITVSGHTNPRAASGTLSQRRAQVVADGLIDGGVDAALIEQQAVRDDEPLGQASSEAGRVLNRYADIGVS
jgi:outer membrane protein OmpA-like peptidoglycan-associated protein